MLINKKPTQDKIYNPASIWEQVMRVCEKQYKYIDTGRFSDDSASWIICSHDAPNKPHKCIVFSFTGDKSTLTDVHMYKYDYPNVSLTSNKIF